MLGKVGTSLPWICLGIIPTKFFSGKRFVMQFFLFKKIPSIYFLCADGARSPFLLSDFVEEKIYIMDIGSHDYE